MQMGVPSLPASWVSYGTYACKCVCLPCLLREFPTVTTHANGCAFPPCFVSFLRHLRMQMCVPSLPASWVSYGNYSCKLMCLPCLLREFPTVTTQANGCAFPAVFAGFPPKLLTCSLSCVCGSRIFRGNYVNMCAWTVRVARIEQTVLIHKNL